eukprot:CAMPEP_0197486306 /NCGR_PEP_ID=MMETSP1311-20131121/1237_1 /TAXON_ID=464262 /ORGANISM="Genus nov. species nov., Strain RCC856" /LENGTH=351 /DNA_ID=CAMNT_0043029319 /DNA_START=107 /DNA_END=1158 /DNA_ORIENTATION=+
MAARAVGARGAFGSPVPRAAKRLLLVALFAAALLPRLDAKGARGLKQVDDFWSDNVSPSDAEPVYAQDRTNSQYISPKEYLVALYVIPLWLCLILVCLRGTARLSHRRQLEQQRQRQQQQQAGLGNGGGPGFIGQQDGGAGGAQAADEEDPSRGLNSSTLQKLKQYSFKLGRSNKYHTTECSVCMEKFAEGDMVRRLPGCGHMFHQSCVDEWLSLHPSCPICRKNTRQALEEFEDVPLSDHGDEAEVGGGTGGGGGEDGGASTSARSSAAVALAVAGVGGGDASEAGRQSPVAPLNVASSRRNRRSPSTGRSGSRRDDQAASFTFFGMHFELGGSQRPAQPAAPAAAPPPP